MHGKDSFTITSLYLFLYENPRKRQLYDHIAAFISIRKSTENTALRSHRCFYLTLRFCSEHNPFLEANSRSINEKIPRISFKSNIQHTVKQYNVLHETTNLTAYFLKNILILSTINCKINKTNF